MSAVMERATGKTSAAPVLGDEDRARAEHYAVLSRLFLPRPGCRFFAKIVGNGGGLGQCR
jgi:hypothetical protein